MVSNRTALINEVKLKLEDAKIREKVENRSDADKARIRSKRFFLNIIDLILLFLGWIIIFYGIYYEDQMKAFVKEDMGVDNWVVIEFAPAITTSLVNYIVPYILGIVTQLEEWDFAEEFIKADLWKNYFSQILNIVLFLSLQYYQNLRNSDTEKQKDPKYNCKEDQFADNLLKLWIFELVFRYVFYFYWNTYWHVKARLVQGFEYRQDFEVYDELVWFFYFEVLTWLCQLVYPVMALISFPILYFHSLYLIYRLQYQKKQPLVASNDMKIGEKMIQYLNITFGVVQVFFILVLFNPLPRFNYWNDDWQAFDNNQKCGPFESNNELSPMQEAGFFLSDDHLFTRIITSIVFEGCLSIFCICLLLHARNRVQIVQEVKRDRFFEFEDQIVILDEKL